MTLDIDAIRGPEGRILVGILGGMGPAATADFYAKLVQATPAGRDQEHLPIVIWSDPSVPNRSAALLENGTDPTPYLIHGARMLARCGATLIAMPCNTAHAFLPAIELATDVPIINMIETAVHALAETSPAVRRVGLMATDGTLATRLYQDRLLLEHIEPLIPTAKHQESLMASLRAIKAGDVGPTVQEPLNMVAAGLVRCGADAIITGCTEVVLGLSSDLLSVPVIDPTKTLAQRIVSISHLGLSDHSHVG